MNTYEQIGKPFTENKLKALIKFLNKCGIDYDNNIEYTINLLNEDFQIIASASLDKNTIKCVAVDDEYRNMGLSAKLLTHIISYAFSINTTKLFLFTKPMNYIMFHDLGFYEIERTSNVLLMENNKNGINTYLNKIKDETSTFISNLDKDPKTIGSIIANCNPFTNGHRYLIEESSKKCDLLHVFILAGDRKYFSEADRFKLVKEGCKDLKNVIIHEAGDYLISPVTFPTYFIKDKYKSNIINCELDIKIFLEKIAPLLNISKRFVATEPNDIVTNSYNEQLKINLENSIVTLDIIERKTSKEEVISATTVRKNIEERNLDRIKEIVPITTYNFIKDKFFN